MAQMPINRRSTLPNPEETVASETIDDPTDGRSADLQGIRLDVYTFIRQNPLCTRDDISRGLDMKSSTATARVKELIDLGYVTEPMGVRKENRSGVRVRCLQATDRLMSGQPNDKLEIEVSLTIDCNGRYGATAKVIGGLKQTGKPVTIRRRVVKFIAPPNARNTAEALSTKVGRVTRLDLQINPGQIVDADYTIVEVE